MSSVPQLSPQSKMSAIPLPDRFLSRRGVAAVELAICLPVLVLLLLATIEACSMYHIQQSLKVIAYEGARVGIVPEAQASNVNYQCETLLEDHGIEGYLVTMDPSDPGALGEGDYFTVTVSAPFSENTLVGGWLYSAMDLSKSVALRKD